MVGRQFGSATAPELDGEDRHYVERNGGVIRHSPQGHVARGNGMTAAPGVKATQLMGGGIAASGTGGYGSVAYRNYVLFALFTVFCFEVVDQILFSLVQESIKVDLGISDFQLGLLGGPAFVILHALAGLPIAILADRWRRTSVIGSGMVLWSVATAACGVAGNFLHLVGLRAMVGIGGAACLPPSHSLISDYFPARQRASALAIYGLAIPLGGVIAAIGGGWLAANYGWRTAFLVFGAPGVIVAAIFMLTVKEPPRASDVQHAPALEVFKNLITRPTMIHITLGSAVLGLFTYSVNQFMVSFIVRRFDLGIDVAAFYFGVYMMTAMAFGIFLGGKLADRVTRNSYRPLPLVPLIGPLVSAPLFLLAFSSSSVPAMVIFGSLAMLACNTYIAPAFTTVQAVAGSTRRASAAALYMTIMSLIGYGFGPPAIGWIADRVRDSRLQAQGLTPEQCTASPQLAGCVEAGGYGLMVALMVGVGVIAWSSLHFWLASRTIDRDVAEVPVA